ncbi:MAG TPA: MATE family efflux transporter [Candidatus Nanopelagicales bacterium]|nr:MATE family efflux transporter [Candidatus Nanopelagicales bacterium]
MQASLLEISRLIKLAIPVFLTQLGMMLLGAVDLVMIGHAGAEPMSAVALGNVWSTGTLILGLGAMLGVDPLVTQAHGARDARTLGLTLQRSFVVAALMSLPIAGLWLLTRDVLVAAGQEPALAALAHDFVVAQIPGIPAFMAFMGLRQCLQGRGIVAPALVTVLLANLLNALLNWVLIFGHFGLPALGVTGAGLATGASRVALLVGLGAWVIAARLHEGGWVPWSRAALEPSGLGEILKIGLPVGLQLGLELWAFQVSVLIVGQLGTHALAAHAIAMNMANLTFQIPLGISMAAVTRIGNQIGADAFERAQRTATLALGLGVLAMMLSAAGYWTLRGWLPGLYSNQAAVVAAAASVLPILAAFQVFDGLQVVGCGVLRGMGRTRPAAVLTLIGYYGVGLPLAVLLGRTKGWGLEGVWWGLTGGIAGVAVLIVGWVVLRGPAHIRQEAGSGRRDGGLVTPA